MGRITIEDISRQTGLSRGTVSRAINDRPDISQRTKQRVLEACRKLHYAPSHAARTLATGRNLAVAVLVDDLRCAMAASFLRGALARAHQAGYAVHVAEARGEVQAQQDAVRAVVGERIDCALVAAPLAAAASAVLEEALEKRPVVACTRLEGLRGDVLLPDHAEAGRLAARHLLGDGRREVLYVHSALAGADDRLAGFRAVCRERGVSSTIVTLDLGSDGPITLNALARLEGPISQAVIIAACDDFLAANVLLMCLRQGRVPGRDVAVMGSGNERFGACIAPALTTVDWGGEELGRRAMDVALKRVGPGRMDAPQTQLIPPELVVRESTANLR